MHPGQRPTSSITRGRTAPAAVTSSYFGVGSVVRAVSDTLGARSPDRRPARATAPAGTGPTATSSTTAAATSAMTKDERRRSVPPTTRRALAEVARSADRGRCARPARGRSRSRWPAWPARPRASMRRSADGAAAIGSVVGTSARDAAARPAAPAPRRASPPPTDSSRLSVSIWRAMRSRPRADRRAHRQLALPLHGAGEQQVGQVRAGDEQHAHRRAGQRQQQQARLPAHLVAQPDHGGASRGRWLRETRGRAPRRSRSARPGPAPSDTPGSRRPTPCR